MLRAGRLGVGLGQLGQVLGRVGVEVLAAVLAAELDLLSLVDEDDGLALGAELLVGDNALVEGVGLRVGGLVGGDQAAGCSPSPPIGRLGEPSLPKLTSCQPAN